MRTKNIHINIDSFDAFERNVKMSSLKCLRSSTAFCWSIALSTHDVCWKFHSWKIVESRTEKETQAHNCCRAEKNDRGHKKVVSRIFRWPFRFRFIVSFSLIDHFDEFRRWQLRSMVRDNCLPSLFPFSYFSISKDEKIPVLLALSKTFCWFHSSINFYCIKIARGKLHVLATLANQVSPKIYLIHKTHAQLID